MTRPWSRSRGAITVTLLLLVWAASATLSPLLAGVEWWSIGATVSLLVLAGAALLRHLRVPRALVPVALLGVVSAAVLLTVSEARSDIALLTPTGVWEHYRQLFSAGVSSIEAQSVPAVADPGILFLVALGIGLIALLMDTLANTLRLPALAGLVVLIPVAVTGLVLATRTHWWSLVLTAAFFVVLLAVAAGERAAESGQPSPQRGRARGALLIGALSLVGALLLSGITPLPGVGVVAEGGVGAQLFGSGVSPMITLGQDLRRPGAQRALTYHTTSARPLKLTLLTINTFEGKTWGADADAPEPANAVENIARPAGLSAQVKTVETTTRIVIENVRTSWLPAPKPALRVVGLAGDWTWNTETRAISSARDTTLGQRYTVTGLELQPTVDQLAASAHGPYGAELESSLAVPADLPAVIAETAAEAAAGAQTPYDQAVALQKYLRSGDFRYDTEAPVDNGYDGSGTAVVATFLEQKKGYCIHFASAMTVMARTLDIPARIAIGYLPGQRQNAMRATTTPDSRGTSGPVPGGETRWRTFTVSSHDLHAWPELYFVDIGWVPFEPTISRGAVPGYSQPAAVAALPGAARDAEVRRLPRPTKTPTRVAEDRTVEEAAPSVPGTEIVSPVVMPSVATLAGLLLALALVLPLLRGHRRAARVRALRQGQSQDGWAEVVDTMRDHGLPAAPTQTPRALGTLLQDHLRATENTHQYAQVQHALARLVLATEVSRFARARPDGAESLAEDLVLVCGAIRRASRPLARLRAVVLPRSLFEGPFWKRRQPA